jgi:predicted nuclease of predicted toxin-antitoxin system
VKVLLDEQLSRRLRRLLPAHQVSTVAYQSWKGIQNGALIALAEQHGFEILVTADQGLRYQQNLRGRTLAVVVLSTNQYRMHKARIASIALALENCTPGSITFVEFQQDDPARHSD